MAQSFIENVVDQQQWLEPTANTLHQALDKVAKRQGPLRAIKDALHGIWFGHPLHPAISDIPIGAWTSSLILDLLSLGRRHPLQWGADATVSIGLVGALAASLAGLADWQETYGRERRIGLLHGLLNAAALNFYSISLVLRRRKRRGSGMLFSCLGYSTVLGAAYLGGKLVFDQGTGVNHAAWQEGPEHFTPVMDDAALPSDKPTRITVGATPIVLVRQADKLYALPATCTHAGGPLDEGELVDGLIVCPWHSSKFCLSDGAVKGGPATIKERPFDVRMRNGKIEVRQAES